MTPPMQHRPVDEEKGKSAAQSDVYATVSDVEPGSIIPPDAHGLQRRLDNRQIQLIAIGGSIGTAVFVSIGTALTKSGPGSLLLAYIIYSCMLSLVNNCIAEMSTYMPVGGGFIRLAGRWVDDAFGFMAGWNFFFYEALLIPFEITALTEVLAFWSDHIPTAAICVACIVLYASLNVLAVRAYGEAEFWLSGGKVILFFVLFLFTFITMVGGNPQGDAYGFRYWNTPGAFATHLATGALGRFEGFLAALWAASFACVGPEYISMVAAESKHPRRYIKNAFKTVYWRFGVFFIGSALCVGVVVAYNDANLVAITTGASAGAGSASASPYVIAMGNLGVSVLPHIVNALLVTSIFSAGNTYTYTATRVLHGLAVEGRAPRIFRRCTRHGVPIYCFGVVMLFPFLSFLQLSNNTATVLSWIINLTTSAGVINYIVMTTTYICFYRACQAQGFDRAQLPYRGWFQPWSAYIGLVWMVCVVTCYGYSSFMPWSAADFVTYYTMVIVAPALFLGWKLLKQTKFVRPEEADLVWEAPAITAYEAELEVTQPAVGFWEEMLQSLRGLLVWKDKISE
ncbi:amino acid transporter [Aspergillus brunneoviolaceus CBS 621.78]|uniref:Amino acid transporter n=1 Tax=Aspergillus brunneoviolaceus CBS 621.78 TaxID=1450534 RepID=A0ACD1G0D8_9EURO|nr:amino acid transporter [Aspergillus brunneoviolaceus CBS 621.78]RAH42733.1 amino acid transporter [Aspergillus brunneoviolaceus CBS 621.78]